MKDFEHEMRLYLDNVEPIYNAAEELAEAENQPTPEQLNAVAESLLETMAGETGEQYNALDLRNAMAVVKEFVKEEQEEREA